MRNHVSYMQKVYWHITHLPYHWSNESTMLDYTNHIIVPYLQKTREYIGEDRTALVIIDNFKGQVTESVIHTAH